MFTPKGLFSAALPLSLPLFLYSFLYFLFSVQQAQQRCVSTVCFHLWSVLLKRRAFRYVIPSVTGALSYMLGCIVNVSVVIPLTDWRCSNAEFPSDRCCLWSSVCAQFDWNLLGNGEWERLRNSFKICTLFFLFFKTCILIDRNQTWDWEWSWTVRWECSPIRSDRSCSFSLLSFQTNQPLKRSISHMHCYTHVSSASFK